MRGIGRREDSRKEKRKDGGQKGKEEESDGKKVKSQGRKRGRGGNGKEVMG